VVKIKAEPHVSKGSAIQRTVSLPEQALCLDRYDLRRAGAFLPLADYKRYTLVFLESLVASALNFAEMCKEILSAKFGHDKSEAFVVIEPLHDTCFCFQCKS